MPLRELQRMRRTSLLLLAAVCAAGCGSSSKHTAEPTTSTQETTTTTSDTSTVGAITNPAPTPVEVRIYFLRDGKVAPVTRSVAPDRPATFALNELARGPDAKTETGLTTAYRGGADLKKIEGGTATVELVANLSRAALAQVVYTLTQFPTVKRVETTRSLGKPLTRASFEDETPSILIESPTPGSQVTSPLRVRGTANTFEATFALDIRNSSNQTFTHQIVTATSGSGTRGTFDTTISFTANGSIWLVAYEPSAENGQPLHIVRIPLVTGG
jgi:germination protein M